MAVSMHAITFNIYIETTVQLLKDNFRTHFCVLKVFLTGNDSNLWLWHFEAIEVTLLNIQSLSYICIHLLRYTLHNKKILNVYQWLKSMKAR